jgi:hypothetical protein
VVVGLVVQDGEIKKQFFIKISTKFSIKMH